VQGLINSPDSLLANFLSGNFRGELIIITGPSGSGKTRGCLDLAETAYNSGVRAGGLVSPAIFKGGNKIGIDLLDVGTGAVRRLAYRHGEIPNGRIVGDWLFDNETIKWGNEILRRSGDFPLIILDELGPLELEGGFGLTNGFRLISERRYQLACVVVRPLFLALSLERWPWGQSLDVQQLSNVGVKNT
jgi:hypothetical protein